ncbi:uncharacterized protein BDZ99DRAFT_116123 [Mytilinidion resinicola]|uniref:Uncharacterized protein n=1 Tax=Mytilinidion resinicola TaxID=574789 RepID=A0A6A6YB53_9PEZI|nr:uncharacterized protein BDZ99DRAFT_116123 [Mytilinidion resinicola]KAF2805244.1 hypothetical protein BDZ99DRAFT_116123 [Mytilinidion resinicola]
MAPAPCLLLSALAMAVVSLEMRVSTANGQSGSSAEAPISRNRSYPQGETPPSSCSDSPSIPSCSAVRPGGVIIIADLIHGDPRPAAALFFPHSLPPETAVHVETQPRGSWRPFAPVAPAGADRGVRCDQPLAFQNVWLFLADWPNRTTDQASAAGAGCVTAFPSVCCHHCCTSLGFNCSSHPPTTPRICQHPLRGPLDETIR